MKPSSLLGIIYYGACLILLAAGLATCDRDPTNPTSGGGDITVRLAVLTDSSATFTASWSTPNTPDSLVYTWETGQLRDTTEATQATFTVPRGPSPIQDDFCVRSLRVLDGVESTPTCASYVIPGTELPPPPDSVVITLGWDGVTPVYDGVRAVGWVYFDHRPEVVRWVTSVAHGGAWLEQDTMPTWPAPLGTDSVPPTPRYPCETRYTMTGDPMKPANSGPWPDGGYWNCRHDVGDPYSTAHWIFTRLAAPHDAWARLDGYDATGKLVAAWAGTFTIPPKAGP